VDLKRALNFARAGESIWAAKLNKVRLFLNLRKMSECAKNGTGTRIPIRFSTEA
jgi:hypothetical protein